MPENQIEEVKQKTDIVTIIGERIELKKAGRNYKTPCPFHGEKTPSFIVSPELQIYKCFGCFPAGQFVKTPFGYHKIEDVVEGEYAVSGKGNLKKVVTTHKRKYKGKLITVKTSQLTEPVSLTEDHIVYTIGGTPLYKNHYKYLSKRLNSYLKYDKDKKLEKLRKFFPIEKTRVGELTKGMTLLYPIDTVISDIETLDLTKYITKKWPPHGTKPLITPLQVLVNEDLLKIIGYYIAEGSNNRAYIRFSLSDEELDFAEEIVELIAKVFGIKATIHHRSPHRNSLEVTACNSILANVFENLCGKGADNKHIPFIFQQLPFEKQQIILEAIFRGDGTESLQKRTKTIRKSITTVSRTLAEQIVDILLRVGYFPSRGISGNKYDKNGVHHKKAFTISWSSDPKVSKFHHTYEAEGDKYWLLPVLSTSKEDFSGDVYNLTIQDDHSYVANNFAVANCGEAGDVYSFLEKYEGMDFYEALKYLADRVGIKLKAVEGRNQSEKEKLYEINALAARFYNYVLLNLPAGKQGLDYLTKERGLKIETIKTFDLGYAPERETALFDFLVTKKKYDPKDVELAGLVVHSGSRYFDRFRGRAIFPIFDSRGNVIALAGRILPQFERKEIGKYINSPETPVYHKSASLYGINVTKSEIKRESVALVVEGELDLISCYQAGIKNIIAIKGSSLTSDHVRILSRITTEIVLALDSDFAGEEAARRGIAHAYESGLNVKVATFRKYKDPDEYARHDVEGLKKVVEKSQSAWDFLINTIVTKYDSTTGEGKSMISKEAIPVLGMITDKIVQAHYMSYLSQRINVPEEAIAQELERFLGQKKKEEPKLYSEAKDVTITPRREILESRLLSLIFENPQKHIPQYSSLLKSPFSEGIISEYKNFSKKSKKFSLVEFVKDLPAELSKRFLEDLLARENDEETSTEKELIGVKREIEAIDIKEELKNLSNQIEEFERTGEKEKSIKAQKRFGEISLKFAKINHV